MSDFVRGYSSRPCNGGRNALAFNQSQFYAYYRHIICSTMNWTFRVLQRNLKLAVSQLTGRRLLRRSFKMTHGDDVTAVHAKLHDADTEQTARLLRGLSRAYKSCTRLTLPRVLPHAALCWRDVSVCLSVRPSVRLSQSCIVSKRLNQSQRNQRPGM